MGDCVEEDYVINDGNETVPFVCNEGLRFLVSRAPSNQDRGTVEDEEDVRAAPPRHRHHIETKSNTPNG